ncbi:hypothetical protein E3P92_02674 [Wallemia ichthyophaga]|uniref:RRM domain-containing protein n=1 Tax=Wallemia ichthyophaga TaxID=245174 RepID=A0A4T0KTI9_WALIC|nr:hypothetical protein E3P91_02947 [Wallemia ichthyophaga]TIA80019.1 hypothetical protein E3P98_02940 [Wallemia ichthyophaga]TIA97827.1 hypothetical protein E3P94_03174 [Wallemia ichthyophaga]TIA98529.1 hypothetical protein E3P95_02436 [Wallemia ichthyophaga]TIB10288.1 hypothetical protein E3P90_02917 [Wallemia ichthyophaga]
MGDSNEFNNEYNNPTNEEPTFEEDDEDKEIAVMKERVKQMEEEAARLREVQESNENGEQQQQQQTAQNTQESQQDPQQSEDAGAGEQQQDPFGAGDEDMQESAEDVDGRSVYVGNLPLSQVDYSATPEDLQKHFAACGTINRVTILCDKFSGHPKGYAYIEFAEPALVENASALNESLFKGRLIKVVAKRKNVPAFALKRGRGRGRGRGFRGRVFRGRGRGSFY